MHIIELKNITHAYGTKKVLEDLSLNIESGRLTCLLGGAGSGKTTILRLIAGLETPEKGKIFIQDKLVTDEQQILVPPDERTLGFIFQDLALWPHFTVYQNVAFGLEERKDQHIEKKVFEILSFFGLKAFAEKYPHQLSGGQQQLVAISRALVLEPKILLMDEPLSGLDVKLKRKILEHIKDLKKNFDVTLIYVTHDHREAFTIADQIIVLNEGKVVETAGADEIKRSKNEYVKYFLEY
jgi:ABC-type Fe3+/spermidine/putrescine transport system ATPase subunit